MSIVKVVISGSRTLESNEDMFKECLKRLWEYRSTFETVELIHGGCPTGIDSLPEKFDLSPFVVTEFPADWDKYGKPAGMIRNREMAQVADVLIAFWDGKSKGTKNMIEECMKSKSIKKIIVYKI